MGGILVHTIIALVAMELCVYFMSAMCDTVKSGNQMCDDDDDDDVHFSVLCIVL